MLCFSYKTVKKPPPGSFQSSSTASAAPKPSMYEEHRRLFGYQPSKFCSYNMGKKGKGKKKDKDSRDLDKGGDMSEKS